MQPPSWQQHQQREVSIESKSDCSPAKSYLQEPARKPDCCCLSSQEVRSLSPVPGQVLNKSVHSKGPRRPRCPQSQYWPQVPSYLQSGPARESECATSANHTDPALGVHLSLLDPSLPSLTIHQPGTVTPIGSLHYGTSPLPVGLEPFSQGPNTVAPDTPHSPTFWQEKGSILTSLPTKRATSHIASCSLSPVRPVPWKSIAFRKASLGDCEPELNCAYCHIYCS